ncbi:MAG: MFS transporter [Ardenticatenia bacterium]|nr:MFS transporter [Ardenticatenia bacterium]
MARWQRTLFIMFTAQLVSAMGFSIIFPFLPLYVQALGTRTGLSTEFWAGMVFSSQAVTMMVASPIWGSLADRYGRKLMVQRAMFGGAVVLAAMGFVRSAEELALLRALQGLITGTVSAVNALVAASTPRNRTGYAMGMIQVGLWGGVAVGPLAGGWLADTFGFRAAFGVTGTLLAVAGLLVWRWVDEPPTLASPEVAHMGFLEAWRHVLRSTGVMPTYMLRFLSWLARNILLPVAPLFVQTLLPANAPVSTVTGLVVGITSAASTASAIVLGRLGDRLGHRRILVAGALLAALFYFPQSLVQSAWQFLALQALTGAAAGGITPSLSALLAHYTQPGEEGAVYGLDNSVVSAARAVAPMLGAGVAVWFGLRGTFVVAGLLFIVVAAAGAWLLPDSFTSHLDQADISLRS